VTGISVISASETHCSSFVEHRSDDQQGTPPRKVRRPSCSRVATITGADGAVEGVARKALNLLLAISIPLTEV